MPIEIPTWPQPREAVPRYIGFGGPLRGEFGGPTTLVLNPGARFALDVTLPTISLEPRRGWGVGGRVFWSRLRQAVREGAIYPFPQPGLVNRAFGDAYVAVPRAANTALVPVLGLVDGSVVREGQFFSIIHGGRRYLHQATAEVAYNAAAGTLEVPILPPLRVDIAAADVIEFAQPMIEGIFEAPALESPVSVERLTEISFTIEEAE